jgi:hypothetical protein
MSSLGIHSMGEGFVPAYQLSATPWVTSSQITLGQIAEVSFSHVTRFVVVRNTSTGNGQLAIGFTRNGLTSQNSNFFILSGSESFSADLRIERIFLSGNVGTSTYSIIAGLTGILPTKFLTVTASNGFAGVG